MNATSGSWTRCSTSHAAWCLRTPCPCRRRQWRQGHSDVRPPAAASADAAGPLVKLAELVRRGYRTEFIPIKLMESLPTAGLPETLRNWSEYNWLTEHLISTGFIHTAQEIWWDVRPSPLRYG